MRVVSLMEVECVIVIDYLQPQLPGIMTIVIVFLSIILVSVKQFIIIRYLFKCIQ